MYSQFLIFASLLIVSSNAKSCITEQGPQGVKCLEMFLKVAETVGTYNFTDPSTYRPTNKVCGKFKRCVPTFACETEPKVTSAVKVIVLFCDAISFFSNEFSPCQVKLDSNTTECSRAWDPFPNEVKDKKKMTEIQKEACKNYFGKNNCMREEIIGVCGKELWGGFKTHLLALNTIIKACDHIDIE